MIGKQSQGMFQRVDDWVKVMLMEEHDLEGDHNTVSVFGVAL